MDITENLKPGEHIIYKIFNSKINDAPNYYIYLETRYSFVEMHDILVRTASWFKERTEYANAYNVTSEMMCTILSELFACKIVNNKYMYKKQNLLIKHEYILRIKEIDIFYCFYHKCFTPFYNRYDELADRNVYVKSIQKFFNSLESTRKGYAYSLGEIFDMHIEDFM